MSAAPPKKPVTRAANQALCSRLSIGIASIWPCRITSCSAVGATCVGTAKLIDFCGARRIGLSLFIPAAELNVTTFADIRKQEDILLRLLRRTTLTASKSAENRLRSQFYDITRIDEITGRCSSHTSLRLRIAMMALMYQARL